MSVLGLGGAAVGAKEAGPTFGGGPLAGTVGVVGLYPPLVDAGLPPRAA